MKQIPTILYIAITIILIVLLASYIKDKEDSKQTINQTIQEVELIK